MYSYFLQSCIFANWPSLATYEIEKIDVCNWWSPQLYCKFSQCYITGASIRCGVTLAYFLYHGGTSMYPQIMHPPSIKAMIIINRTVNLTGNIFIKFAPNFNPKWVLCSLTQHAHNVTLRSARERQLNEFFFLNESWLDSLTSPISDN